MGHFPLVQVGEAAQNQHADLGDDVLADRARLGDDLGQGRLEQVEHKRHRRDARRGVLEVEGRAHGEDERVRARALKLKFGAQERRLARRVEERDALKRDERARRALDGLCHDGRRADADDLGRWVGGA